MRLMSKSYRLEIYLKCYILKLAELMFKAKLDGINGS